MIYRILVSNGYESDNFYTENEPQAHLLFNMAVSSKMFAYVEMAEVTKEYFTKREWCEDDEEE